MSDIRYFTNDLKDHVRGAKDAVVTIEEYGDFECPSCQDVFPVLRRIQNKMGDRLKLVFRHFPLVDQHPNSFKAAEAAEAAAAQGDEKFWLLHDRLYESQNALTLEDLEKYATEIGLDVERFIKEIKEGVYKDLVEEDIQKGKSQDVSGTPTIFINDEEYSGALEYEEILEKVAETGDFTDILESLDKQNQKIRKTIDQSQRGAPAAGQAVRDRFSSDEIFQRVMASADEEIDRNVKLLFFSGLAAGLIIGASFFGRVVLTTAYPQDSVGLGNLLYPIGFIAIVLGGYQLFTENTLTPVTLVLTRLASIPSLLRLWSIVLFANVSGAAIGALLFANTGVFSSEAAETASKIGEHALSFSKITLFYKAAVAGGLVATMVWLVHAARDTISRLLIIYIVMILIPAGELFHCVVGAFEIFYLVYVGSASLLTVFIDFFIPVVLGNIMGGVIFVAFVNYAMTSERSIPSYNFRNKLCLKEWILGNHLAKHLDQKQE
ncbi:formate/nitrite transporter family protein [Chondrinema litorale]|uniref:formate/nitrite transporter family protein n=1 Tax=Chondrinema litorale TaxID=2994555 RepID=UPI0025435771|nr:formate/nitrite transporter family protein [Chondrinema litorale]UZR96835.1 formate/nitrite transporter family protein [Chondrinema litorale]